MSHGTPYHPILPDLANLKLHWPGILVGGAVKDFGTLAKNGTITGSVPQVRGPYDRALELSESTANYVKATGTTGSFNEIHASGVFTLAFWYRRRATPSSNRIILRTGGAGSGFRGLELFHRTDDKLLWNVLKGGGTGLYALTTSSTISGTGWHSLVFRADGANLQAYLDKAGFGTTGVATESGDSATDFVLGSNPGAEGGPPADIAQVVYYGADKGAGFPKIFHDRPAFQPRYA